MELLIEEIDFQSITNEVISESISEGKMIKNLYLSGPHLQAVDKNQNERSYPYPVVEREVNKVNEMYIKNNRFLGELNHPNDLEINLERVSHMTTVLKMDGNIAYGKSKVLDTPLGLIAKKICEGGAKLGVSSRGAGTLKNGIVQNDYSLKCVDIVSDPSGQKCFVEGIMESKEWVMENGILTEKQYDESRKALDKIIVECKFSIEDKRAAFLNLFQKTLQQIGKK